MKKQQAGYLQNEEVRNMLGRLYPGENVNQKYSDYRCRKKKIIWMVIICGIGACICTYVSSHMQSRLQEGTYLYRNEWGKGNYTVFLSAVTDLGEETLAYEVAQRAYTLQELSVMLQEAIKCLPSILLEENESLNCVRSNLNLPSELTGYPFAIAWESSDYKKIRTDGVVNTKGVLQEGEKITLTATFSYHGQKWQHNFTVRLLPPVLSRSEERVEKIKQLLAKRDEASQEQKKIILPDRIGNEKIVWQEKISNNGIWFLILGIAGAMAVAIFMDRDLQKKDKERQKELEREYPEFITKLQLYMGAGLTMRNTFFRMGSNYRKEKEITGKRLFLYEEVLVSCYQLSNARAEDEVYREWAKRCDEIHYRKLGFLLVSYRRQGNDNILNQFSREVYLAWEESRRLAKKQGEEAETKLLFPMILMLVVVMSLILVPVYIGF